VTAATDFDEINYFRSGRLGGNPFPYWDYLRAQSPVLREPHHGVFMVTGYEEAVAVFHDHATFSSCNGVSGPFAEFPVPLQGDDISAIIEEHRDALPFSDQLPTFDPPKHTAHRALLMRLITPKRLNENEEFMWRLADRQIDEIPGGRVRVHQRVRSRSPCSSSPTYSVCRRRTTRAFEPSSRPTRWASAARSRSGTSRWSSSTTGSPPTSRIAGAIRATT
jgi:cytochrome P450